MSKGGLRFHARFLGSQLSFDSSDLVIDLSGSQLSVTRCKCWYSRQCPPIPPIWGLTKIRRYSETSGSHIYNLEKTLLGPWKWAAVLGEAVNRGTVLEDGCNHSWPVVCADGVATKFRFNIKMLKSYNSEQLHTCKNLENLKKKIEFCLNP